MIRRTPTLHAALKDVAAHEVDFHSGYSAHPRGFGWHNGGEVPQDEQVALAELSVVQLIGLIPASISGAYGAEVTLTVRGQRVLSEWDKAAQGGPS